MSVNNEVINKVKMIVANAFEVNGNDINENSSPSNIVNWDSLGQLSLIHGIEQEFNISMEIDEIFSILNVGDIYNLLEKRNIS